MKIIKMFNRFIPLLRKLTIFDQLLILISFCGLILFAYIFFRQASYVTITLKVEKEDVYYSIYDPGLPAWFENFFFTGMTEKNGLGTVQAEVLDINSYYKRPQTISLYLKTKLRVTYSRASDQYTYKGAPVVIGTKLKLYLNGVMVDGLVTNIEGIKDTRERKIVRVETKIVEENSTYIETSGTKSYVADALNSGDEIKDLQGQTVIKILNKKVEPAKKITTNSNGILSIQPDPVRKDVYLTLELNTTVIQGRFFIFDDIPVLIDQVLPLNTPTIYAGTTVTKFLQIK